MQGWARVGFAPGTGGEWLLRLKAPHLLWKLLEAQPRIGPDLAEALNLGESSGGSLARDRAAERIETCRSFRAIRSRPMSAFRAWICAKAWKSILRRLSVSR